MGFLGTNTSCIFSNQPCHTARSLVHILFLQRQLTPLILSLTSQPSTAPAPLPVLGSLVLEPPGSGIQIHLKHERISAFHPAMHSPPAAPLPAAPRGVSALRLLLAFSLCHACSVDSFKLLQSNVICCSSCSCFQVQGLIFSCLSYAVQISVLCSELPDLTPSYL